MGTNTGTRQAIIHRMVMPEHVCPYEIKSMDLLRREGFRVEDHWLRTRAETDAFMAEQQVETTPQTYIDGQRVVATTNCDVTSADQ